jgi:hypothetical protein
MAQHDLSEIEKLCQRKDSDRISTEQFFTRGIASGQYRDASQAAPLVNTDFEGTKSIRSSSSVNTGLLHAGSRDEWHLSLGA